MLLNVVLATMAVVRASSARFQSQSLLHHVEFRSSGFGLVSERNGLVSETVGDVTAAKVKHSQAKISLLGKAATEKLISSTGAQVLKSRLFAASTHMRDAVLAIEALTDSVEMGFKKPQDLKLTAADLDGLDSKLAKPMAKVSSALQTASDDLKGVGTIKDSIKGAIRKALGDGTEGVAATKAAASALRRGDVNEGISQLTKLRTASDGLDEIVSDKNLWG